MMFLHSQRSMCSSDRAMFHWLTGLTFLAVGVIGLLEQLNVFSMSPWGWAWPIIVVVWGLLVLFNVGCKECAKL